MRQKAHFQDSVYTFISEIILNYPLFKNSPTYLSHI